MCAKCDKSKADGVSWNGAARWAMLHRRALAYRGDAAAELAYLGRLVERLPCPQCVEHFAALLADEPPDFSSADAYWAWTVRVHNLVNVRIGRPVMTVDEAQERWGRLKTD